MKRTPALLHGVPTRKVNVELPAELWDQVRRWVLEHHGTQRLFVAEALENHLRFMEEQG